VRAALMALTTAAAGLFGRRYSASRALLGAGFVMLIQNPKILVFDPSFQLSFLATIGLIKVMPYCEKFSGFVTQRWKLRGTLAQTIATQITVLPLLVYSVGDVSVVSLPANLLILMVVPWTMFLGFLAVVLSYLGAVLAWPVAFATHLFLSWILLVSRSLGSLSFATLEIPPLSFGPLFLFYVLLAGILTWPRWRNFLRLYSS
jgi:competence protein ComEC